MSRENVESLRAFLESAARARDSGELDLDLSLFDPDVVFEDSVLPDHSETYRGHGGMLRALRTWLDVYERFTMELQQIAGTGDRLVSIHHFRGRGRFSGIEEGMRFAYVWTFRDGKVIHFVSFRDPAEALESAGLRD